jgi:hypothetical protein
MLQNVVYMKKVDVQKRKKKKGGGQHLKKRGKKGSSIGSCPQVPVEKPTKI